MNEVDCCHKKIVELFKLAGNFFETEFRVQVADFFKDSLIIQHLQALFLLWLAWFCSFFLAGSYLPDERCYHLKSQVILILLF